MPGKRGITPGKRNYGQLVYFDTFDDILLHHKRPKELELLDDGIIAYKGKIIVPQDQVEQVILFHMKRAIECDRSTVSNIVSEAGQ